MKKYKISEYARMNRVTVRTIWNWINDGKIKYERTKTNRILILEDDPHANTYVAIYARVSSRENITNLERQKQRLLDYCAAKGYVIHKTVTEIGSGLNDTRPKLESLLLDNSIKIIVVEHKDRIARFGFNYIEKLLNKESRQIEIINEASNADDDLMQDFVSIITSFTARLYGLRRSKRRTEEIIKAIHNDSSK